MTDWTAGYVADISYTFGYYPDLNPLRSRLALLHAGICPPEIGTACELGFGQGISINIHAAAAAARWHGTDFNPAQAAFARGLAGVSGAPAELGDKSFAEFAARPDLPSFDFIGLHGVWSWVSDANRGVLVDFIRRRLNPGGVLYIGYNTQPGWASFVPIRRLLAEHAGVLGAAGQGTLARVDGALEFIAKLFETAPAYTRINPHVEERVKQIKQQNRQYLAHEFFNLDWEPMHFADLATWLAPAKLTYACSAHYSDHVQALNLSPPQQEFLRQIPDRALRETVRNVMTNQQFRRDYWIRGERRLSALDQGEALRRQRLVLCTPRSDFKFNVSGMLGEASMTETVYGPILDALADHQPRTLAELERVVQGQDMSFPVLLEAVMLLVGKGDLVPAQDEAAAAEARVRTDRLNRHLLTLARGSHELGWLASPVTAGGLACGRLEQLCLLAAGEGHQRPQDWAAFAWQTLSLLGQKLIEKGRTLETAEENIAELTSQARNFADRRRPMLQALQVA